MKILALSDARSTIELPDVAADLVVLLGHIPSKLVKRIDEQYDCMKVGLLSDKCHPTVYEDTSIVDIHKRVFTYEGLRFAGYGGVPLFREEESIGQYSESETEFFVKQLAVSNVDVLLSYSNLAYGDLTASHAKDGFLAYNQIILENMVSTIIHGRLMQPLERKMGNVKIHSVYPFAEIQI
ncbi:hypothetical protein M3649_17800 [Ureibacillus chungkukjangi]|uniref:metallophosphoesterase family protein n=1 Tax=Ureibacillus chungkukjangi TaxID=1202712 RepID=UPI00203AAFEA|nr:hypothetical protein [Ureibacillus chungkukjangi]MCM3389976.1 hypothetical protein [Ureibacillus chungkukjangi]